MKNKRISFKLMIFDLVLFSFFFFISQALLINYLDSTLYDFNMILISLSFLYFIIYIIKTEEDKFSPLVFFSLLFMGYSFSGLYFSYYENIGSAKFFNFAGNFNTEDMKNSLLNVIIGYSFFVLGYKITKLLKVKRKINFEIKGINYNSKTIIIFLYFSFLVSFLYWIYVSYRLSGGPIELLSNIGIYVLLLQNNYISTAPYMLAYMSVSMLFLIYLNNNWKIPIILYVMIILSFLMYVSTGRLSGSVFYLLSFSLMYILFYEIKLNYKLILSITLFVILLFGLYFYREYSNLSYLGLSFEEDILTLIGKHFFGMTNFGDLQSVTFSKQYAEDNDYLYGLSFTDFYMEWISRFTGIYVEPNAIGLRLREYYFSHVNTGAPAPGIISEVLINFGIVGITIVMFIIGFLVGLIRVLFTPNLNIFNLYIYVHFLLFLLLLSKVDSSHINHLIWAVAPFYFFGFILKYIGRIKI